MTYASYNEIISLSKSLGFDTTNNADLIREYFFLTLIHSWKGKNAGSKAIYESSKFFNIWNRYQMDFFDSEQVGKTSFWETVDALLLLFQINNLYDFQIFLYVNYVLGLSQIGKLLNLHFLMMIYPSVPK